METATSNGGPIVYRYNSDEFPNFTGNGYISFGNSQVCVLVRDSPVDKIAEKAVCRRINKKRTPSDCFFGGFAH